MNTNENTQMNTNTTSESYLFKAACFKIVGACMAVQNELGNAFLEPVYQEALALELDKRKIPYERESRLAIQYKDAVLDKKYFADFICYGKIVVELKVCRGLAPEHIAQALNYLSALKFDLALLVNFGTPRLQWKRVILSQERKLSSY